MSQASQARQGPVDVLSYIPGIQQSIKRNENNKEELKSLSQRVNTILESLQRDTQFIERLIESETEKIGKLTLEIQELREKNIPEHQTQLVKLNQKTDKINIVMEKINEAIQKILRQERQQRERKKKQQDELQKAKFMERITNSKTSRSFRDFMGGGGGASATAAATPKTFKEMKQGKKQQGSK
jgi:chromosome segregation ATPase